MFSGTETTDQLISKDLLAWKCLWIGIELIQTCSLPKVLKYL